ncbi:hypothetical protein LSH36_193g01035 [Paralvinella palmiformis]|uniref:Uncharacterized protein n=1 Tax=Paralvinella palmiformis TaxID=53620 RepID=A0AAD9JQ36_9ANNE|nr:hypothetical protein LSH36_193g01035 [Paralvinella palmiformis]
MIVVRRGATLSVVIEKVLISRVLFILLPVASRTMGYCPDWDTTLDILRGIFIDPDTRRLPGYQITGSQGFLYPTCYAVMRHWTTPTERSWLGSIVLTGIYLGPVVGLSISGAITNDIGWQYVYYVHGIAIMVWFVLWITLSYEKPGYHPYIRENELMAIEKDQGSTSISHEDAKVPWKCIMTSLPVHALNICNFARNWIFYLMLTNEPLYLTMFGFTVVENGLYSALPHAVMAVVAISTGPLADSLIQRMTFSRTTVRKIFTGVGFGTEALCFIILGFISTGTPAITFLTLGIGISGISISGWQINHLDLAPRYASVLVGISTTVGTVAGILIPIITGILTRDLVMSAWHDVFFLSASILIIAVIFYGCFGSGELQPWAEPQGGAVIINDRGPLDEKQKPYGTFPAQTDYIDPQILTNDEKIASK